MEPVSVCPTVLTPDITISPSLAETTNLPIKLGFISHKAWGWSVGAMALGNFPVLGRPTIWMMVGQGPIALAVGAGGGLFGHFYSPLSLLSSFSVSLGVVGWCDGAG